MPEKKAKRRYQLGQCRSFLADPDVEHGLKLAVGEGFKITFLCNAALRQILSAKGFIKQTK